MGYRSSSHIFLLTEQTEQHLILCRLSESVAVVYQWLSCVGFFATAWTAGSSVLHDVLEFAQIHVRWVYDAIWTSHSQCNTFKFSSVQLLGCVWLFVTPWTTARQASLSITNSGVHSNSCPSSQWCHPAISSSVIPFCCSQSLPASGSFPMSQLFESGGQSIGVSALASVLPMNTQDWSPLRWTGWISLQSKGLSRVFSNTTVQKHQFFSAQLSSQSNSHFHTWPLEKP